MDIIDRLDNEKMFVDAIDDAIAEIKALRRRVHILERVQAQLAKATADFRYGMARGGVFPPQLRELYHVIKAMVEA